MNWFVQTSIWSYNPTKLYVYKVIGFKMFMTIRCAIDNVKGSKYQLVKDVTNNPAN